jgi:hypothetical protein
MKWVTFCLILGLVLMGVALLGWGVAHAWYADDACPRAEALCTAGDLGLAAWFYLGPLGVLLFVAAGATALMRSR